MGDSQAGVRTGLKWQENYLFFLFFLRKRWFAV